MKKFLIFSIIAIVLVCILFKPFTWKGIEITNSIKNIEPQKIREITHEVSLEFTNDPFFIYKSDSIKIFFSNHCVYSGGFYIGSKKINIYDDNFLLDIIIFDNEKIYSFCPKDIVSINEETTKIQLTFEFWNDYSEIVSIKQF